MTPEQILAITQRHAGKPMNDHQFLADLCTQMEKNVEKPKPSLKDLVQFPDGPFYKLRHEIINGVAHYTFGRVVTEQKVKVRVAATVNVPTGSAEIVLVRTIRGIPMEVPLGVYRNGKHEVLCETKITGTFRLCIRITGEATVANTRQYIIASV